MDELTKVKVLLMQEVKDSSLPKGGKLLLLDLVVENEDLDQTAEILEAFAVIDETVKEKLKTWLKKHKRNISAVGIGAAAGMLVGHGLGKIRKKKDIGKENLKTLRKMNRRVGKAEKSIKDWKQKIK